MNALLRRADVADGRFDALVLAAGRGPDDPMARAYGITHKCVLDVAGVPMILRVLKALADAPSIDRIVISIEDPDVVTTAPGFAEIAQRTSIETVASADRASASVAQALSSDLIDYPVLVTTADHALLTPEIVETFCAGSNEAQADVTAGLATADTILGAYPGSARTFLKFADGRYSGCNLFTFNTEAAMKVITFWQGVERNRKKPWRLIGAFGIWPLVLYLAGAAGLKRAFELGSKRLGLVAKPVVMPMAEAAIDVDKPEDLVLVELILAGRED